MLFAVLLAKKGEIASGNSLKNIMVHYIFSKKFFFISRKIIFEKNTKLRHFYHEKESLTNYFVFLLLPLCFRSEHIFQGDQHSTDNGC